MPEIDAAPPAKPRITQTASQRWLESARRFLADGESMEAVDAFLQREGCPPRLRQELLRQADVRSRGWHRGMGLRLVVIGLGVMVLGGAVESWATSDVTRHGSVLAFWGWVIVAVGAQVGLAGAWKLVTGSRVDLTADRH